jgi:predicted permease
MQRTETERERGTAALCKMWWATITDIIRMAPREHLSVLAQDVRYALRMMRKNTGYTAAAVLILGLGIGVNTAIFSVVNSVLLRPLPYAEGDDLVVLRQPQTKLGVEDAGFSPLELEDYRRRNRSLDGIEEYHAMNFLLFGRNEAHRVRVGVVSPRFFDLFGVKPLFGRTFAPGDDAHNAEAVLVLSYEFWKQTEGGDPRIIGKVYQMNDKPHTVVGVLPPIPQYPNENDVYMPTSACPARSNPANIANRNFRLVSAFGRLKPEATVEMSRRDLSMISHTLQKDYPQNYPERAGFSAAVSALRSDLTHRARPMLLALLGAAAFVLLIACANVANLVLARMARREHELVIRTAVGAGGGRLLRQLLTESSIMAVLSAGIGVLFAAGSMRLLAQFAGLLTPRAREIAIDGWVLAFAILCASATTIIFGSIAGLYSRHDVAAGLKEGGSRQTAERSRRVVRGTLIAAQVAFSFVLLIGAGLMVRSFLEMKGVDPGFVPQRLFAVGVRLNGYKYNTPEKRVGVANRLLEKVRSQSGVMYTALSSSFPLDPEQAGGTNNPVHFRIEGDTRSEAELPGIHSIRSATPDYFKTLGIPLVAG